MSTDTPVDLTKEQKRARKEEKRAKKAAKAESSETKAPIEVPVVENGVKEKKQKKDKKEKRKAEDTIPDITTSGEGEEPKKKKKKDTSITPTTTIQPESFTTEHNDYLSSNAITLLPPLYPPHLSIPTLPVDASIAKFLTRFTSPTPIQACSWPPLLANRDVVGIAETGSGKTLGFGVPGLQKLSKSLSKGKGKGGRGVIRMLVIAPTRELALQSHETILALGEEMGVGSVCVYGGVGKDEQIRGLRDGKTGVVVGTPGRMLDLADQGDLDLSNVEYLVLDEADRMLDQGFENDIRRIIAHCPGNDKGRQTVMFSATWPESVRRLASTFLNDAVRITVGSDELTANKRIEQIVEVLEPFGKDVRLLHHLKSHLKANPSTTAQPTRILVFALYKKEAQRLESTIKRAGYSTAGLHGDLSQDARFKALDKFKTGGVNVLVATDVAARGLDIPDVGLVINVTFPLTTEDFVHRCGRTGRAGKSGKAVTFFTGEGHEKALAGEFMRVIRDAGGEVPKEMDRFPSTIKKKEHGYAMIVPNLTRDLGVLTFLIVRMAHSTRIRQMPQHRLKSNLTRSPPSPCIPPCILDLAIASLLFL